jgi:DNA-binding response OmpR family regulator
MIVDDDRDLLQELAEVLASAGYEPIVVESGGDAPRVAMESKPDLVLLDLYMPAKDGFSVALELTRTPETSRIPLVGMTGIYDGRLWANLMMLCGFDACLVKPIDPEKLFAQIETTIREKDAENERSQPACGPPSGDERRPHPGE